MSRNGLKDVLTAAPSNVSMASDIDTVSVMMQVVGENKCALFSVVSQ